MKLTDLDYVYCLNRDLLWPDQCNKCNRNISLYEKADIALFWTSLNGKKKLKKCPEYEPIKNRGI